MMITGMARQPRSRRAVSREQGQTSTLPRRLRPDLRGLEELLR